MSAYVNSLIDFLKGGVVSRWNVDEEEVRPMSGYEREAIMAELSRMGVTSINIPSAKVDTNFVTSVAHPPPSPPTSKNRDYTEAEDRYIKAHCHLAAREIQKGLPWRTENSVSNRLVALWKDAVKEFPSHVRNK